jgi:hypothetical protein
MMFVRLISTKYFVSVSSVVSGYAYGFFSSEAGGDCGFSSRVRFSISFYMGCSDWGAAG